MPLSRALIYCAIGITLLEGMERTRAKKSKKYNSFILKTFLTIDLDLHKYTCKFHIHIYHGTICVFLVPFSWCHFWQEMGCSLTAKEEKFSAYLSRTIWIFKINLQPYSRFKKKHEREHAWKKSTADAGVKFKMSIYKMYNRQTHKIQLKALKTLPII